MVFYRSLILIPTRWSKLTLSQAISPQTPCLSGNRGVSSLQLGGGDKYNRRELFPPQCLVPG